MSEEMPSGDELFGAKEIKISKDFGIEGQALEDLKKPTEVQVVEHYPAMKADQGMQLLKEQMQIFIKSKLLPEGMTWAQGFTIASYGKELGMKPLESLQDIYIVKGKPAMSAKLMKRRVHEKLPKALFQIVMNTETETVIKASRDAEKIEPTTYTMTRAECDAAGWTKDNKGMKYNWRAQPATMLLYRLISKVCRIEFPDCLGSVQYTPEELGAEVDETDKGIKHRIIDPAKNEDELNAFNQRMKQLGETEMNVIEVDGVNE